MSLIVLVSGHQLHCNFYIVTKRLREIFNSIFLVYVFQYIYYKYVQYFMIVIFTCLSPTNDEINYTAYHNRV